VPAVIFPIEAIIAFYHEKDIPIFVDGAHAVCQTDIDIKKLNPDGYVSNFHKWAYAPKQAAFVYISDKFKTVTIVLT
jgi:isopenicillin-N epimerase